MLYNDNSVILVLELVLCTVEAFPYRPTYLPTWPDWIYLRTVVSKPGANCRDTCLHNKMVSN